jgi:hypothetical protein
MKLIDKQISKSYNALYNCMEVGNTFTSDVVAYGWR